VDVFALPDRLDDYEEFTRSRINVSARPGGGDEHDGERR
jgi:hypothetical protein